MTLTSLSELLLLKFVKNGHICWKSTSAINIITLPPRQQYSIFNKTFQELLNKILSDIKNSTGFALKMNDSFHNESNCYVVGFKNRKSLKLKKNHLLRLCKRIILYKLISVHLQLKFWYAWVKSVPHNVYITHTFLFVVYYSFIVFDLGHKIM